MKVKFIIKIKSRNYTKKETDIRQTVLDRDIWKALFGEWALLFCWECVYLIFLLFWCKYRLADVFIEVPEKLFVLIAVILLNYTLKRTEKSYSINNGT